MLAKKTRQVSDLELSRLKMLAHPIRLKIYNALSSTLSVREIARTVRIDRELLYYHVRELLKTDLIRVAEVKQEKNTREAYYRRVDDINITIMPGQRDEISGNAIACVIQSMVDDFVVADKTRDDVLASASRRTLKVKPENLNQVAQEIIKFREEAWEKLKMLSDEDSEDAVAIEILLAFFQKG